MPGSSQDKDVMMLQALQAMQAQLNNSNQQAEQTQQFMEQLVEKLNEAPNNNNTGDGAGGKSRAKGRNPERLEREVDYASFLQWEKTWNLYVISDRLETLTDRQRTAVFFTFFTKELLSDMKYRFKIDTDADQKVE